MSAPSLSPKPRAAPSDARATPRLGVVLAAWLVLWAVTAAAPITTATAAAPATTPMVNLGSASAYAVLSGASVGNTVSAPGTPHTTLRGSLGVKANTQPTGFPPGVVTGSVEVATPAALAAHADVVAAYDEVAARTGGDTIAGALAGSTIGPGLHSIAGAVSNTSTVTLDAGGDANAVFVFQVNGAMAMAAGSHVVLTGGARAARVFWQVNGAGAIGAGASFAGTLMALDAVAVGNGSVVNGRAFARNGALTLDDDEFYSAPPTVAFDGGATASTTDTTPTVSGTTDIQAPALVTVTINGQTLTATPASGAWSITSAMLANATYSVVATVVDGAGNASSATQSLTVDTLPPVIGLDGAASLTTSDTTPTVAGTSDVAPGTIVHVTFGSLALTALVQPSGAWNITPPALLDGTYAVTASVADPAGNASTAHQSIVVDTVPPALTLAGGASVLTRDATPEIAGTAAVAAGTSVTVSLADETLSAVTLANGGFSVTAAALADGPHRVVTAVSDAAGNSAIFTQILTVDTVAPAIAITGGAVASTTAHAPTITGTSDAAPGTTVTVEIAGQTMTTILQANGTWNATPPSLGEGAWAVSASAQDPAGNQGVADQTLTILPIAPAAPAAVLPAVPAGEPIHAPAPTFLAPPLANLVLPAVAAATTVAGSRSQKVGARSLSVWTRVTAPAGGGVLAAAHGTVRIRGARRAIVLSHAGAAVSAGGTATMKIALKGGTARARADLRRIKAAIAKGTRVTATITVSIADAAGATRTIVRAVMLTA